MDTGQVNFPTLFFIPANAYVSFDVDCVLNNYLKSCYFMRGLDTALVSLLPVVISEFVLTVTVFMRYLNKGRNINI
jgi:hypothetical protein